MRVAVLTTSYPRVGQEHAGRFIADAVEHLRARGVEIEVLAPGAFADYGLARGDGVMHNLRRRPWAGPAMLASMARAARRAAGEVDLLHAHWLPAGGAAMLSGRPFVVTLHGTDLELARRAPWLARRVLQRAKGTICVSRALADGARGLGGHHVEVIPNGVELPAELGTEADPPEVLFVGRLSPEKGVEELVEATRGLSLVVAGDGPLRERVPHGLGSVSDLERNALYRRAAVVVCPSRREGFGMVCAEAMAYGKPVVASAVGGLLDLVVDGETGLLVPPRDPASLRAAIERLLEDSELRRRLGRAARARVGELCAWPAISERTVRLYEEAVSAGGRR